MRTKLRRKLDELEESFWSDDELNDYINEAYLFYWDWLIIARDNRCLKHVFLDIVANNPEISLPADFLIARLVEKVQGNRTIPLRWNERFEESNNTTGVSFSGSLFRVRFEGNNLVLEPTPGDAQVGGIKLTYYFSPARLVEDTDEPNAAFKDYYQDIIPYRGTIIAKAKEESIGGGGADLGSWAVLNKQKEESFRASVELPTVQRQSVKPFFT